MTSSAWRSGLSSAPNDAWMPPCAFEELQACRVVFVATATRAPADVAATPAASPAAPLPITSTSMSASSATSRNPIECAV